MQTLRSRLGCLVKFVLVYLALSFANAIGLISGLFSLVEHFVGTSHQGNFQFWVNKILLLFSLLITLITAVGFILFWCLGTYWGFVLAEMALWQMFNGGLFSKKGHHPTA